MAAVLLAAACGGAGDGGTAAPTPPAPPAPPAVATVTVAAPGAPLVPGASQQLTAAAGGASGSPVAGATVRWSSQNAAVATVTGAGVVTAVAPGTARIEAAAGAATGWAEVTVLAGGLVTAAGGTVASADGRLTLLLPANAVAAPTPISIAARPDSLGTDHTVPGTRHVFGPTGTQFAQPVGIALRYDPAALPPYTDPTALRVARLTNGEWVPVTEGMSVDTVTRTVRAQLRSFSHYSLVSDPCAPADGGIGGVQGMISVGDCQTYGGGSYGDYYRIRLNPGMTMFVLDGSGSVDGVFGVRTNHFDGSPGTIWADADLGQRFALVADARDLELYVIGRDSTKRGSYRIVSGSPVSHSCGGTIIALTPNAIVRGFMQASNSCAPTVRYSPVPGAIGKPLWTHNYVVKLEAGYTYTITAGALPAQSALTVFGGAGGPVAQHVSELPATRTVTVRPASTRYHTIEVSSGGFDGNGRWIQPTFSYAVQVSGGR